MLGLGGGGESRIMSELLLGYCSPGECGCDIGSRSMVLTTASPTEARAGIKFLELETIGLRESGQVIF